MGLGLQENLLHIWFAVVSTEKSTNNRFAYIGITTVNTLGVTCSAQFVKQTINNHSNLVRKGCNLEISLIMGEHLVWLNEGWWYKKDVRSHKRKSDNEEWKQGLSGSRHILLACMQLPPECCRHFIWYKEKDTQLMTFQMLFLSDKCFKI